MADPGFRALLTPGQMAEADRMTIMRGTPGIALMERAGQAVADSGLAMLRSRGRSGGMVAVLCGPGNNGGDGFVAARLMRDAGCRVQLYLFGLRSALSGDAAGAAEAWDGSVAEASQLDMAGLDLLVDGLFGAGLSRPLGTEATALVERINASGIPVLAIDVPSGIDGSSGQERRTSLRADVTVTFFRPKPGHYLYPGAARRGRLVVADIGIAADVLDAVGPVATLNTPALWLEDYPWPKTDGHKYTRGHAVVVSGGMSHTGAARMSARAALRIGAGLVTLASPSDALAVNAAHLTAIMLRASDGAEGLSSILSDARKNAVVLGPGLGVGEATRLLVAAALAPASDPKPGALGRACVLDADALTSFAGQSEALAHLIGAARGPVVITPHDGEFARLFSNEPEATRPASKLQRVHTAARLLGCIVLLKGADTAIAHPDGRGSISSSDAPWLATAGSGDVLSGLIGGLLAQAMPTFEAANAAVWIHATAASRFGPGLIAEDLPEVVPGVLGDLLALRRDQDTSNQQRSPATF